MAATPPAEAAFPGGSDPPSALRKADQALQALLETAHEDKEIEVACIFSARETGRADAPEKFAADVDGMLQKVAQRVGYPASRHSLLKNIGCLAVTAKPSYIRALLDQDEVASAMANEQPQELCIRPVEQRNPDSSESLSKRSLPRD